MKRRVKNTFYTLSILGGIHSLALAANAAHISGAVTVPGYGGQEGPIQLELPDLINKCDELERHEQIAKFTADITCVIDQNIWANGPYTPYQTDYEPFFAEFDLNVKGKFNSNWIPLTNGRKPFTDLCPSVEQWRITAIKSVKVHSCDELRAIEANPRFCEDVFATSSCVTQEQINAQIQAARKGQQSMYDDQECHGERLMEIVTGPSAEQTVPVEAQQIPSGEHRPASYQELDCSQLGTPLNLVLKTVDMVKGGQTVQAVQVIDQGEMQDRNLAPNLGQMSLVTGSFPRSNDILWRINGRRVERPEEACQLLADAKSVTGGKVNPLKMSFYSESDLSPASESYDVGTSRRKHLVARF